MKYKKNIKYCDPYGFQRYTELMKELFVNLVRNKYINCPNCGVPITSLKCEYCGTKFNVNVGNIKNIIITYERGENI